MTANTSILSLLPEINSSPTLTPKLSTMSECEKSLKNLLNRNDLGFFKLPERILLWDSVQAQALDFKKRFKKFVVVGIGGSSLGAAAILEIFPNKNLFILDNVDPAKFRMTLTEIPNLSEVAWIFISKSGGTIETLATLDLVNQLYSQTGLQLEKQSAVITETRSNSLWNWAKKNQVPILEVPLDVGGRFSVLTPVGMFPAALLDLSLAKFRIGAQKALDDKKLVVEIMARMAESFKREEWISLFWFYNSSMKNFGGWLQQLWCESLAKRKTRNGNEAPRASTAIFAIGACDQHSILQQVMEGYKDKFVLFFQIQSTTPTHSDFIKNSLFKETELLLNKTLGHLLNAEMKATYQGLREVNVSALPLQISQLSEETLGYLFMFWELVVGGLGELMDINAFDQPGVELGKKLTKGILEASDENS